MLGGKLAVPIPQQQTDGIAVKIRDREVGPAIPVHITQRHRIWLRSRGERLLGDERAVPVPQQYADGIACTVRNSEVGPAVPVHITQCHRIWLRSRGKRLLGDKRAVPIPQQYADGVAEIVCSSEVEPAVPVHITQRHGTRTRPCGEGLLGGKRAVPIPQQHADVVAVRVRDSEVGLAVPVHITQRHGTRVRPRGEGGLIRKTGGGVGCHERIAHLVVDAGIVDQIQTECAGTGNPTDGHRVDRSADRRHLRQYRPDCPRSRQREIGRIDTCHRFAERRREADAIGVGRRVRRVQPIHRNYPRRDIQIGRIDRKDLSRKVAIIHPGTAERHVR